MFFFSAVWIHFKSKIWCILHQSLFLTFVPFLCLCQLQVPSCYVFENLNSSTRNKKNVYITPKNCGDILPKYVDNSDKTPHRISINAVESPFNDTLDLPSLLHTHVPIISVMHSLCIIFYTVWFSYPLSLRGTLNVDYM